YVSAQGHVPWASPGGDYSLQHQTAGLALPAADRTQAGDTVSFDVTPLARDAIDEFSGSLSLMLKRTDESGPDAQAEFFSSDNAVASDRPRLVVTYLPAAPAAVPCTGDCAPPPIGDGVVDLNDMLAVINGWGHCPIAGSCPGDINLDGEINLDDL